MDSFAKMARRTCSDCGSGLIVWSTALDLALVVDPSMRVRVFELIRWCGADAQAWRCAACANFGVFGAVEMAV